MGVSTLFHCECDPGFVLEEPEGIHCKPTQLESVKVDVLFVLDSSNSLRREDWANELGMVVQVVERFQKVS